MYDFFMFPCRFLESQKCFQSNELSFLRVFTSYQGSLRKNNIYFSFLTVLQIHEKKICLILRCFYIPRQFIFTKTSTRNLRIYEQVTDKRKTKEINGILAYLRGRMLKEGKFLQKFYFVLFYFLKKKMINSNIV